MSTISWLKGDMPVFLNALNIMSFRKAFTLKEIVKHIQIGLLKNKDNYAGKEMLVQILDTVNRLEDFT